MAVPVTARVPVPFYPPGKPLLKILIRVPTPYERDAFAATLVRGGVVHYSRDQIREIMKAGVLSLFGDAAYDEYRGSLEEVWAAGDAMNRAIMARTEKEIDIREREMTRFKELDKVPTEEEMAAINAEVAAAVETIQPDVVIDEKKRIAVATLQQDVTSRFAPLQKAFADLAEQKTKRDWLSIETYVSGWAKEERDAAGAIVAHGLEFTPDGNGRGGITRAEAEYLRGKLGDEAFQEVGDFIFAMHSLNEDEEKNLASLLENMSAPVGSTATASTASSEDGSSTVEHTGETPETP